jgi:hypothetical protein
MPNGKTTRRVVVLPDSKARPVQDFLKIAVENIKFLGDYQAVYYRDSHVIEAAVRTPYTPGSRSFESLPGIREIRPAEDSEFDEGDLETTPKSTPTRTLSGQWLTEFENTITTTWRVEIGSNTFRFGTLLGRRGGSVTIRIEGIIVDRHDDLVRILEKIAGAVLFELEVKYGIVALLATDPSPPRGLIRRRQPGTRDTRLASPRFEYQYEALSLYSYACSARATPLLQYLSYYQVLEFYFPSYAQREVLERVRNQLKDPGFQLQRDTDLGRVIATVKRFGSGYGNEIEQLKATVRACVEEDQLRTLVDGDGELLADLVERPSPIKGLKQLRLNDRQADLRDQVATRVYDIRCRIVHTKDTASERVPDLLLPFSNEASSLYSDIFLLRYLAQKALPLVT